MKGKKINNIFVSFNLQGCKHLQNNIFDFNFDYDKNLIEKLVRQYISLYCISKLDYKNILKDFNKLNNLLKKFIIDYEEIQKLRILFFFVDISYPKFILNSNN